MKPGMLSIASIFAITVPYCTGIYAGNTHPASCFQSEKDYETYQEYGDTAPKMPKFSSIPGAIDITLGQYMKEMEDYKHGPARRKAISLKHTVTQANGVVTFDATGSTTPSGQIKYGWWSEDGGFRYEKIKYPHPIGKGKPGESITLRQMVDDPVCELHAEERVTFTFQ